MTVYIEYVIIDNFVIDYLLLKATFALTNAPVKKGRLLFCAFLGAGISVVFPLIQVHAVILTLIKIATGLLLVLIANNYKSVKQFYITALIFIGLTFATGGAIIGVYNLLGLSYSTELSIGIMILPAWAVIKFMTAIVKHIYRKKEIAQNTYRCELTLDGVTVKAQGFFDTGNNLYDGDKPVIVCDKKLALKLFGNTLPKLGKMQYSTTLGRGEMFTVRLSELKIYFKKTPNIIYNVTLGVAKQNVGGDCGVILHPAFKEMGNDTDIRQAKSVS